MAPKPRAREHELPDDDDREEDEDRPVEDDRLVVGVDDAGDRDAVASERLHRGDRGIGADLAAFGKRERDRTEADEPGEGRDEGWNPPERDEPAVEQAAREPHADRGAEAREHRRELPGASASTMPESPFIASMPTAAASAITAPTERSMPPATMTSVMPTATIPTAAFWLSRLRRFSALRNVSPCQIALKAKRPTKATITPYFCRRSRARADPDRATGAATTLMQPAPRRPRRGA